MSEATEKAGEAITTLLNREWWQWFNDPRFDIFFATNPGLGEGIRLVYAEKIAENVKEALLSGELEKIEALGRAAANPKMPERSKGSGLVSREYKALRWVSKEIGKTGAIPTTKEVSEQTGISLKTVQRAYKKLAEESGLHLDGRGALRVTG